MASTPRTPRRGLPRVPGGEPWPPAASGVPDTSHGAEAPAAPVDPAPAQVGVDGDGQATGAAARIPQNGTDVAASSPHGVRPAHVPEVSTGDAVDVGAPTGSSALAPATPVRRGLPREAGGQPWPPASAPSVDSAEADAPAAEGTASDQHVGAAGPTPVPSVPQPATAASDVSTRLASTPGEATTGSVRRGLPREPGGEPWPPVSAAPARASVADDDSERRSASSSLHRAEAGHAAADPATSASGSRDDTASPARSSRPSALAGEGSVPRPPLTVPRTVWPGAAASRRSTRAASAHSARPASAKPPRTALGDFSPVQLLGSTAVLGIFALALAGIVVLLARFVLALGPGQEFLAAYPGEYHLPEAAPVGIPAWLNWSHFLNSFFLLFIIRTGWQVRNEKRPAAFWSPRKNKRRRISLTLWFHQAIDILWIANGVIFVVLLFVTGQWMRIVPTSWEVFPNALSAALQYVSLDWPTENGWVNYNSLQQLSYFAITFVAAPLAIVSGVRLSGVWPKDAERLNRLYPIEWARKVHFPVMLFFVAFIVVHVALVLATGALRNLNHMYAARGSVDPDAFMTDPTGLLLFAASLVVMAAGVVAARPRVLVPIARLFGEVKQR